MEVGKLIRYHMRDWLKQHGTQVSELISADERRLLPMLAQVEMGPQGVVVPTEAQRLWREIDYGSQRLPRFGIEKWLADLVDHYLAEQYNAVNSNKQ